MNKVFVLGRLGEDPRVKITDSGRTICNMSMATSEKWVNYEGEPQERTEWHKVAIFGKLGEVCGKNLTKGARVLVEGRLQTRSWEDKEGTKKYTTEVIAQHVQFIELKEKKVETQDGNY